MPRGKLNISALEMFGALSSVWKGACHVVSDKNIREFSICNASEANCFNLSALTVPPALRMRIFYPSCWAKDTALRIH